MDQFQGKLEMFMENHLLGEVLAVPKPGVYYTIAAVVLEK